MKSILTHNTQPFDYRKHLPPRNQIAIDAEWDKILKSVYGLPQDTICTQFVFPQLPDELKRWICFNRELKERNILPESVIHRIEKHCKLRGINLRWVYFDDSNDVLNGVIDELSHVYRDEDGLAIEFNWKDNDLLMFSSPRDIWISHGWANVEKAFDEAEIDKKRNIHGTYTLSERKFHIWDTAGWTNEGLKNLADSVGVETKDKGLMDKYKANMLLGLLEEPEMFIDYSMNDPEMLPGIVENFTKGQRDLQLETLELPEHVAYTVETIPKTVGSVVAQTIQKVMDWKSYPKDSELIQYCLRIMGVLDESDEQHLKALEAYNFCVESINNRADFEAYRKSKEVQFIILKAKFEFYAYSYCSVKWCGSDTRTSNAFNALVHGGRAHNEQPKRYRHGFGFDADERSAYGTQLAKQKLPVGLPRVICQTPNQEAITVGDFLDKYLPKCEPYQWQVVISGKMPIVKHKGGTSRQLMQDLITSKRVTQKEINKAILSDQNCEDTENLDTPEDLRKIPGDFGVFKTEVVNGILTQRVLEAYMKTASNEEIKALRSMKVESAIMYYSADKVTVDEWIDKVLADKGKYTTNDRGNPVENRTLAWFPFDIGGIFSKTLKAREYWKPRAKKLKKQLEAMVESGVDVTDENYLRVQAEQREASGKQEALKLFNNTGYGVLISPYFPISNVIVGNNITSGIRVDTWMLKVALAGKMCITDGTPYSPHEVLFLTPERGKKPSLTTIADIDTLLKHRAIKTGNLGGIDWVDEFETAWKNRKPTHIMICNATTEEYQKLEATELDRLATVHVNNFWVNYGLVLNSSVEHKNENIFYACATWGKADYAFLLIKPMTNHKTGEEQSDYLIKLRGCKQYPSSSELRMSPKFELMRNILHGADDFPDGMDYDQFSLCTPSKYRQVTNSKGYLDLKGVRPGDDIVQERHARFNNDWCVESFKEYDTRKRRTLRKDAECFERFRNEGIRKVHKRMMDDRLRD